MMSFLSPKLRSALIVVFVIFAYSAVWFCGGWFVRAAMADRDIANIQLELEAAREAHRVFVKGVEDRDAKNTEDSTKRTDKAEAKRVVEFKYVDREVIRYVQAPRPVCHVDPEWVCLYNRALGLECAEASPAGPEAG